MSVSSMFINSSNELGQFESGVAASIDGYSTFCCIGRLKGPFAVVIFTLVQSPDPPGDGILKGFLSHQFCSTTYTIGQKPALVRVSLGL